MAVFLIVLWLLLPVILIPAVIVLSVKYGNLKKQLYPENKAETEKNTHTEIRSVISEPEKTIKKPPSFSPVNIILIIGVIFIMLSGIIFSTTNWENMNSFMKTVMVFSASIIFYALCIFSEKKLKLRKTGIAFFTLGSIFLPSAVIAAGFFRLFGAWLSFEGHGRDVILMISCILLWICAGVGTLKYSSSVFAAVSLSAMSGSVIFMTYGMFYDGNKGITLCPLIFAAYALLIIISGRKIRFSEIFSPFEKIKDGFVTANTAALSVLALLYSGNYNGTAAFALIAFSLMFLDNIFSKKIKTLGVFPFAVYLLAGLAKVSVPDSYSDYIAFFCAGTAVSVVLSEIKLISDILRRALKKFSYIMMLCAGFAAVINITNDDFTSDIISVSALFIIFLNTLWLSVKYNSRPAIIIQPVMAVFFVNYFCRYMFADYYMYGFIGIFLLFALYYYFLPFIRTIFSDTVFSLFCLIQSMIICDCFYFSKIVGGIFFSIMIILIAIDNSKKIRSVIASYSIIPSFFIAGLNYLTYGFDTENELTLISVRMVFVLMVFIVWILSAYKAESIRNMIISKGIEPWIYLLCIINIYDIDFPYMFVTAFFCMIQVYWSYRLGWEHQAAFYIYANLTALCAGFMIQFGNNYYEKVIVMVCFGIAIILFQIIFSKNQFISNALYNFAHISLCTSLTVGSVLWTAEMQTYPWHMIFWCISSIILYIYSYTSRGSDISGFCSVIVFYMVDYLVFDKVFSFKNNSMIVMLVLLFLFSSAAGHFIHRKLYIEKIKRPQCHEWLTILSAIIPLLIMWCCMNGDTELMKWPCVAWLLLADYVLFYLRYVETLNSKRIIITVSGLMMASALFSQQIFPVYDAFRKEFDVLIVIIFSVFISKLWKGYEKTTNKIIFSSLVISFIYLAYDAFMYKDIIDIELLISGCILMMIFSFIRKFRIWFAFSSAAVVFIAVYITKDFWLSIQWWVYLLATGIVFVAVAGLNEYMKIKGKDNLQIKFKNLFRNWR